MIVNIDKAEEIANHHGTNSKLQKRLLRQVIEQVGQRRKSIQEYLLTVDTISQQYHRKKSNLEQLIHQLDNRGMSLDQGLAKISNQKVELERRQLRIEKDLQCMRMTAEQCREKKVKCEQQYSTVAAVPILSAQSKRRYIKARDRYSDAEQQVSETRQALEKCKEHLKLISKTVSAQCSEQDQLCNQRRGSVDTIVSSTQQLEYLRQGYEFWSGFDNYQAQVVLESAIYLYELGGGGDEISKKKAAKKEGLDVDEVWIKTFKLACFEYGDREIYGDSRWNMTTLEINFDCDMCQTSQLGWPKVIRDELACEVCYTTLIDDHKPQQITALAAATASQITIIDPTTSLHDKTLPSIPTTNGKKMKKLFSNLFNYHHPTKIDPVSVS